MRKRIIILAGLCFALAGGCDATTRGLQVQPPTSPFPYNSPYF